MFSLPLLYTMEVWWAGFVAEPMRLLLYIVATFVLLLGYNHYAGLHQDASWSEVVIDSVEEMGLGLLVAAGVLFLLGQLETDMRAYEVIGKITVEAMTVAIGISIGTSQLAGGGDEGREKGAAEASAKDEVRFGGQLVIAGCGAMLFAANVAPTEEIIMIATESRAPKLVGLALLSLLMTALILFYIEFTGSGRFVRSGGVLTVVVGTIVTYAVALVVSAAVLWFFGRFDQALIVCLSQIVVLGFAATLGASAGRLLLQ
jgi:putative integral membrane protein (TIGR02587 family)